MDQAINDYIDAVLEITRKDEWEPIQNILNDRIHNLMYEAALNAEDWGRVKELRGEIKCLLAIRNMCE